MSSTKSEPTWSRKDGHVHLSYELPHRVHVAKPYPVRAPNGSTVLVYGHDDGLTLWWRGGRRPVKRRSNKQTNTSGDSKHGDDVIMVDDDEEAYTKGSSAATNDDYEDDEDELDLSKPYPSIVHTLDISLETAVYHLAFAPLSRYTTSRFANENSQDVEKNRPSLFTQDIVLAVTCANASIHLITTSLAPTLLQSQSFRDIIVSPAETGQTLRSVPGGVSMTWTTEMMTTSPPNETLVSHENHLPKPEKKNRASSDHSKHQSWTLLLATHTSEGSGVLKIYAIPVSSVRNHSDVVAKSIFLFRTEYLPAFARHISFKPTPFPAKTHTQLLLTDTKGFVRLYDPLPGRSIGLASAPISDRGVWLASFRPPLDQMKSSHSHSAIGQHSHKILEASWALAGTCIVVILGSGHWGVWDIMGSAVLPNSNISGVGIAQFALRGYIGKTANSVHPRVKTSPTNDVEVEPKRLAPMTPNTRKAKQEKLFVRQSQRFSTSSFSPRGGISICSSWTNAPDEPADDSLILWYDTEVYEISSLRLYWQRAASKSVIDTRTSDAIADSTLYGSNPTPLSIPSTGGEAISGVTQLPVSISTMSGAPSDSIRREVSVCAEHRLLFTHSLEEGDDAEKNLEKLFEPLQGHPPQVEQNMLSRGELDLDGMEKLASNAMSRGLANPSYAFNTL